MRRLWLLFAQAVTVCIAILFVVTTLRPDWLRLSARSDPRPGIPVGALGSGGVDTGAVQQAPGPRWPASAAAVARRRRGCGRRRSEPGALRHGGAPGCGCGGSARSG